MSGLGSNFNDTATTPNRKTHIIFDVPELVAQQPAWAIERPLEAIVPVYNESDFTSTNVELVPGIGWRLASIHGQASNIHENNAPTLQMITPTGYNWRPTWVKSSQTGATYAGDVTNQGDYFFNRQFAAGGDLTDGNYNLVDDQSAFPSPLLGISNAPMYRVGIDQGNRTNKPVSLALAFEVRGNPKSANDYVWGHTFNGVLGWEPNSGGFNSTGVFYLACRGDGRAEVWVMLNNGSATKWVIAKYGWYCDPSQVVNRVHRILIEPVQGPSPNVSGGFIYFRFTNSGQTISDPPLGSYMTIIGRSPSDSEGVTNFHFKYTAPGVFGNPSPPNLPARVESRQDLDVAFQTAVTTYQTTGNLLDQPIQIPFYTQPGAEFGTGNQFQLIWWGDIPDPQICTIAPVMYATDTPDTGNPTFTNLGGSFADGVWYFTPLDGQTRFYQLNFLLTTSDVLLTPTLTGYRVIRNGQVIVVSPGGFEPAFAPDPDDAPALRTSAAVAPLSINFADNDPTTAHASVVIQDIAGELPRLQARGDFPAMITTDFVNGAVRGTSILHRGYCRIPESEEIGNHDDGGWHTGFGEAGAKQKFNYGTRFKVKCEFTGAWQRFSEALMPVRHNFTVGSVAMDGSGQSYLPKVTDALRELFYYAGYDDSQLLIPDLDIQLFPTSDKDSLMVEPDSSIQELVTRWSRDYLGAYVYFEPNYGTYGKWCILEQLQAPYTFLCNFTPAGPAAGKIVNSINSYPSITVAGQSMPQAPMLKGWVNWIIKPPEGNYVIGYGAQENSGGDSAGLTSQLAFNTSSFLFSGFPDASPPNPDGIDWLSRPRPIKVYLPSYAASDSNDWTSPINFAVRRIYDISCHGRVQKRFTAPLMIIQDPIFPTVYRPLRFYDPVYVEGKPCLIRNVSPIYGKDDHQLCSYLVEQLIDGVPPQVSRVNGATSMRSAVQNSTLGIISETTSVVRSLASDKRMYGQGASTISIGVVKTAPIQDTAGNFVFMLDYDSLG